MSLQWEDGVLEVRSPPGTSTRPLRYTGTRGEDTRPSVSSHLPLGSRPGDIDPLKSEGCSLQFHLAGLQSYPPRHNKHRKHILNRKKQNKERGG